jgi:hypothetical protein
MYIIYPCPHTYIYVSAEDISKEELLSLEDRRGFHFLGIRLLDCDEEI